MKLRISAEELKERKLFVATPRYGAVSCGVYADAFDDLRIVAERNGLSLTRCHVDNDSCIARARNTLADEFLRSDCTHLLFWDGDIQATPDDVLGLVVLSDPTSDKDVVCGLYPKKHICWDKIVAAVKMGVAADQLEHFVGDFVFNPVGLSGSHDLYTPLEVAECGTGFMLIQRHVFERFLLAYPDRSYKTDHHGGHGSTGCFFLDEIDPQSRRFLTEDYNFCRLIRAIGLKVWVAPWLNLNHFGSFKFVGNVAAVSALVQPETRSAA